MEDASQGNKAPFRRFDGVEKILVAGRGRREDRDVRRHLRRRGPLLDRMYCSSESAWSEGGCEKEAAQVRASRKRRRSSSDSSSPSSPSDSRWERSRMRPIRGPLPGRREGSQRPAMRTGPSRKQGWHHVRMRRSPRRVFRENETRKRRAVRFHVKGVIL